MAASLNNVQLIGTLGRDPELKAFPNGGRIAKCTIATTQKWKDKATGEPKEHTEWHTILFNDRLADVAEQYLKKGSSVYVQGTLHHRKYQDADGTNKYATEIKCREMQMLGGKPQQMLGDNPQGASRASNPPPPAQDIDDDIPF